MKNPHFNEHMPEKESSRLEKLERDVGRLETDIDKKSKDLVKLDEKEKYFLDEIEKLRFEYEQTKRRVLEEGQALGLYDNLNRQFAD